VTAVSVVVVAYRSADTIGACLDSVLAESPHEVIVVDNDPDDATRELVQARYPDVVLIANDDNRGFAAGVNQGAARADGAYLLLLNPDAALEPGAIAALAGFLDASPDAAAAGAALRYPDGGFHAAATRDLRLRDVLTTAFPRLGGVIRSGRHGGYPPSLYARGRPFEVRALLGTCLMVRRDVFVAVGGLDERFFLYMEEIDFALRVRALRTGANRLYVVPAAVATHVSQASSSHEGVFEAALYEHVRSQLLFFAKHRSRAWAAAARAISLAGLARRTVEAWAASRRDPARSDKWRRRLALNRELAALYLGRRPTNAQPSRLIQGPPSEEDR
jgi:GT2 family glycosyltransferase